MRLLSRKMKIANSTFLACFKPLCSFQPESFTAHLWISCFKEGWHFFLLRENWKCEENCKTMILNVKQSGLSGLAVGKVILRDRFHAHKKLVKEVENVFLCSLPIDPPIRSCSYPCVILAVQGYANASWPCIIWMQDQVLYLVRIEYRKHRHKHKCYTGPG